MDRKQRIHKHIEDIGTEILGFIKGREGFFQDRWVPAQEIRESLELNFVSVPIANKQYGPKGWLFAIVARQLEDKDQVEFKKVGNRSFYRSTDNA